MNEIETVLSFGRVEVYKTLEGLKPGDVVLDMALQGEAEQRFQRLGLPAVFGCVEESGENERREPQIVLWSTMFATPAIQRELAEAKDRTFSASDIAFLRHEPAETYIPRESGGRFHYGQRLRCTRGVIMTLDSYFNGMLSGINENGEPYSGGAAAFEAIEEL